MGNQKGKKGFFWWGDLLQTLYIQDFVGSYGFCFCCCGGAIWHFYSSYFDQIYICSILEIFYLLLLCFQAYSSVLFSTKRSATIMSKCLFVHLKTKANEKLQEKKKQTGGVSQMWAQSCVSHKCICEIKVTFFFFFFEGDTFFRWILLYLVILHIAVCSYSLNLTNSSKSSMLVLKICPTLHSASWQKVLVEV